MSRTKATPLGRVYLTTDMVRAHMKLNQERIAVHDTNVTDSICRLGLKRKNGKKDNHASRYGWEVNQQEAAEKLGMPKPKQWHRSRTVGWVDPYCSNRHGKYAPLAVLQDQTRKEVAAFRAAFEIARVAFEAAKKAEEAMVSYRKLIQAYKRISH